MTIRISEYYDLFDVKVKISGTEPSAQADQIKTANLPNDVKDTHDTNTFSGFSNWTNFNTQQVDRYNPNVAQVASVEITGQHKAPQAITNIDVLENGDIICYPPNVSVPYWNKIIFRNYDYMVQPDTLDSKYKDWVEGYTNSYQSVYPAYIYSSADMYPDNTDPPVHDATRTGKIYDYSNVPIFLKYDMYPSRSKVIFSSVDKTRNPDIEYNFGYHHGQMEPIKLNLSVSCNNPILEHSATAPYNTYQYNGNLTRTEIGRLLVKCYWSIEWIYERETGN